MPFINKNDSKESPNQTDLPRLFMGRFNELHFFVEHILRPTDPSNNIISIWGHGGVGKSTLLARFISEAHTSQFQDYCLTAIVNERQVAVPNVMEKFAEQLQITGRFAKALVKYKEAYRKPQVERETRREALLHKAPELIGSLVADVPIMGNILKEGVKSTTEHIVNEYQAHQLIKEAEVLEDPIHDLTKAFVEEINLLADTQVTLSLGREKRRRRIILFFDTFEQLAGEVAPWLLNHFLETNINNSIVLVVAGRDPIEGSNQEDPKLWLSYRDNNTIHSMPLNSLTREETYSYLLARGIAEPTQLSKIWELSHGLPLYLSLLTSNPRGRVDPTKDVVSNFLRWIPEQEQIKRQLALDVALLSKPLDRDDLEAFPYLDKSQKADLFQWLIQLPFVTAHAQDGRYNYPDLVQTLFSRHLYQRSKKEYITLRRTLAKHYQELLLKIEDEGARIVPNSAVEGKPICYSIEWLEVAMEVAYQKFFLPGDANLKDAVEKVMQAYECTQQTEEIVGILQKLSQEEFNNQIPPKAQLVIKILTRYIRADWPNIRRGWAKHKRAFVDELLASADSLLHHITHQSLFSPKLLAYIYRKRGFAYRSIKDYSRAIADFNQAIEIEPGYARAYASRGSAYRLIEEYKQAINDYDMAIEIEPSYAWAFTGRGETYRLSKKYLQAIEDLSHAIELEPNFSWAYHQRGRAHRELNNFSNALDDLNRAIELTPNDSRNYSQRGFTNLLLNHYQQALEDYELSFKLDSTDINAGWMAEWLSICQENPDPKVAYRLIKIALVDPEHYLAYVCRGVAKWLLDRSVSSGSLEELEIAISLDVEKWDAHFWKGIICSYLGRDKESLAELKQSLKVSLPRVLLSPLRWLEQDRPDFYEQHILSLMNSH